MRKLIGTALAAGLVSLGVLAGPAPAFAASTGHVRPAGLVWLPGGCAKSSHGPFVASACDSASGFAGIDMNGDAYIDAKPAGCFSYAIDLRDNNSARLAGTGWRTFCGTGHLNGTTYSGEKYNQPYFSELTIVDGSTSYVFDSPYLGYVWQ